MPNLTLLNRRRGLSGSWPQILVDDFTSLSPSWLPQAGSLAVAGGALQAETLGDWLGNIISNASFENSPGSGSNLFEFWSDALGDGAVDIETVIVRSGAQAARITSGPSRNTYILQTSLPVSQQSKTYHISGWMYGDGTTAPSLRVHDRTNGFAVLITVIGAVTAAWGQFAGSFQIAANTALVDIYCQRGNLDGAVVRFDDIALYLRTAPALLAGWLSPNHITTLSHVSPAAGVVPFGYICRYTDSLNYWEVRVLPNTAGNDLQIIQVTDGVETVRAEADVDWTSDDTDELEVTCSGSTISTAHRKSGAGVWTAGPSYASATQGQTSPKLGVMLYETGVGRVSNFEVRVA